MNIRRGFAAHAAAALLALAMAPGASAQDWPTKPVRLVAAFPPGTPGDVIARLIQPSLQQRWGQTVVVENKPGAGGNLAAAEVARARDDHTLLVGPDTILTINPHLYKKLTFNLREALRPVTYFASFNQMLVCNTESRVQTLEAFTRQPASKMYASGGTGTPSHMAMAMLLETTRTELVHVPYKGPGPAAQDVMAGHVDCGFIVSSVVLQHVQGGRLHAIAVSGSQRSMLMPAVPTVAEKGYAGFDATFFETLMAPSGMNAATVGRIQRDVHAALSTPEMKARLAEMDLRVEASSPQEAERRGAEDYRKWGAIAARAKLQLD
ncbi:tripartite tricarboxylate transporter substrate-binding protein [Pigmentiphaga sp.]|uniref:Bug family tripartite tricarboxylate transporter substrate binding protein n=1 Tax=Pigmentiphaga sp. TaxID=1977564 RepID=UPI0025CDF682|nr:tripartite tricarboxylate transporter substrate-binding protein [Pigmentiphaga sp.]